MSAARDNVLGRVRKALGKREHDIAGLAAAEAIIAGHAQGPRPTLAGDRVERFMQRARDMESTVERIADRAAIPPAVARYLDGLQLPPIFRRRPGTALRSLSRMNASTRASNPFSRHMRAKKPRTGD